MSKYEPLEIHLIGLPAATHEITLSFAQLEALLGDRLPPSAFDHQAWWGNERPGHHHVHAHAWWNAGFEVEAVNQDRDTGWVRFRRR